MPAIPLGLYVHLPWCVRKCPYCDFNSHQVQGAIPETAYVDALLSDLEALDEDWIGGRAIETIFFGGGTPSLFSPPELSRLLQGIEQRCEVTRDVEVTMEANPGTVDAGRFAAVRELGINRLSIGVQSFRDAALAGLGRIHDGAAATNAFRIARQAGFDNINVDLMYALPGDDAQVACADLQQAIDLEPEHLSWYQLTIEPDTAFFRKPPVLPSEETIEAIETQGRALLAASGYQRYEVSAYAQSGQQCRHNENYWRFGDYLGIGAGAHGKITSADGRIVRTMQSRSPLRYMNKVGTGETLTTEQVDDPGQIIAEFMMNALRLPAGFDDILFYQRTGLDELVLADAIGPAIKGGLLERQGARIQPTALGQRFLDDLVALFLTDSY